MRGDNHPRAGKFLQQRAIGPMQIVAPLAPSIIQTMLAALLVIGGPPCRVGLFATLPVVRTHLIPNGTVRPGFLGHVASGVNATGASDDRECVGPFIGPADWPG